MTVYSPDNDDRNADWSKRTWDLPKTANGFIAYLRSIDDGPVEDTYRAFLTRPSSRVMPKELRAKVEVFLFGGLPVTMVDNVPRQVGDDGAPSTR